MLPTPCPSLSAASRTLLVVLLAASACAPIAEADPSAPEGPGTVVPSTANGTSPAPGAISPPPTGGSGGPANEEVRQDAGPALKLDAAPKPELTLKLDAAPKPELTLKLDAAPRLDAVTPTTTKVDAMATSSPPATTPSSTTAPSKFFDLSHWKLQIPGPKDIAPSTVAGGYQSKYFYADATARTLLFWLDTSESGSTANSTFVRSELREQLTPGDDKSNWDISGTHILSARLRVKSSTADPDKVTVLQIHGYGDTPPLIKFAVQSGSAYALIKTDKTGENEEKVLLASGVGRDFFDAEIKVQAKKMTVTVNGTSAVKDRDISFWPYPNYFKAGNYPQAHTGIVVVEFQKLATTHQ